jgi:hypothetical protein
MVNEKGRVFGVEGGDYENRNIIMYIKNSKIDL